MQFKQRVFALPAGIIASGFISELQNKKAKAFAPIAEGYQSVPATNRWTRNIKPDLRYSCSLSRFDQNLYCIRSKRISRFIFINVGQGDAALMQDHTVPYLIDGGPLLWSDVIDTLQLTA
jgi:hypothetical protein